MKNIRLKYIVCSALLAAAIVPAACTVGAEMREVTAERIARPAFMVERRIQSGPADYQLWERMHQRFAPANVYIEGDGDPRFLGHVSRDTTPTNPVALHLASRDNAQNLVYISRPCQFRESPDKDACNPKLWSTRRFSPEVIAGYSDILDEIKRRYDITEFNLIGYDGGANIASALALSRSDIVSLRTVAGNLNTNAVYDPKTSPLDSDSFNAFAVAPQLAKMPQHHFIGAADDVSPPSSYHTFRQEMGESKCVHYTFVQDADHEYGWVEKWPDLLKSTIACEPEYVPAPLPPRPVDKDLPNK